MELTPFHFIPPWIETHGYNMKPSLRDYPDALATHYKSSRLAQSCNRGF
jgi:hypothetical protein